MEQTLIIRPADVVQVCLLVPLSDVQLCLHILLSDWHIKNLSDTTKNKHMYILMTDCLIAIYPFGHHLCKDADIKRWCKSSRQKIIYFFIVEFPKQFLGSEAYLIIFTINDG